MGDLWREGRGWLVQARGVTAAGDLKPPAWTDRSPLSSIVTSNILSTSAKLSVNWKGFKLTVYIMIMILIIV